MISTTSTSPRSKWSLHITCTDTYSHRFSRIYTVSIDLSPQLGVKCHCCTSKANLQQRGCSSATSMTPLLPPPPRLLKVPSPRCSPKCVGSHEAGGGWMRDKWKPNLKSPFAADASTDWNAKWRLGGHCTAPLRNWSPYHLGPHSRCRRDHRRYVPSKYCYLACRALLYNLSRTMAVIISNTIR